MNLILINIILSVFNVYVNAQDILGCGGFVKSHISMDFSKVEVKLYVFKYIYFV